VGKLGGGEKAIFGDIWKKGNNNNKKMNKKEDRAGGSTSLVGCPSAHEKENVCHGNWDIYIYIYI
jgi:hypothetical protein